jgi:hypothetical protein
MWQRLKLGFGLLLSTACILVGYAMLGEASLDINSALKCYGQINSRKAGKYFTFTLAGAPTSFKVYKASRNYNDLESALNIGDSVTVYFGQSSTTNMQVYQIEKQGHVIVGKELLEGQNKVGGYISCVGGFVLIGIAIGQFRKGRN